MRNQNLHTARKTIALALALFMGLPAAFGQENVASQITAMPAGAKVELHLNNKQTVRGTRGPLSNAGFALLDAHAGNRQIAFDEVVSVKQLKSHTTRNVLIGVGIGVAAIGITLGIIFRCGGLGCGGTRGPIPISVGIGY
jgi:hypothetical protein